MLLVSKIIASTLFLKSKIDQNTPFESMNLKFTEYEKNNEIPKAFPLPLYYNLIVKKIYILTTLKPHPANLNQQKP